MSRDVRGRPSKNLSHRETSYCPLPADLDGDGAADEGLVEKERELIRLLIEYDKLSIAWPKGRHVLVRAKIGRQVADALTRIDDLEHAIAETPARTPAGAAVRRRRLAALERAGIIPWGAFWPRPWRRWRLKSNG